MIAFTVWLVGLILALASVFVGAVAKTRAQKDGAIAMAIAAIVLAIVFSLVL